MKNCLGSELLYIWMSLSLSNPLSDRHQKGYFSCQWRNGTYYHWFKWYTH